MKAAPVGAPVYGRRGFLGALGVAAGVMVFTPRASAGLVMDLAPQWWRESQGRNLRSYADYLLSLRLGRISVGQILEAHAKCRGGTWNHLPPMGMWKNITPTLRTVDRVAAELAEPVAEVVSVYRSPLYNAKCPGAANGSYHTRNNAIDVRFGARPAVVAAAATQLRARGLFHGGIGHYPTFTHIDTRGADATW